MDGSFLYEVNAMKFTRTSGREFQQSVGIATPCEMCDLLHIDIERQRDLTTDRESRILFLVQLMFNYRREINMWKLLAFTGWVAAILMAWTSLHHG